jgi:hypothetical protein
VAALLRQRRAVDHQHRAFSSDQPVGLSEQFRFRRRRIPNASAHEVMQPVVVPGREARRHRLHALAVPRSDRARDVEWAHPLRVLLPRRARNGARPRSSSAVQSDRVRTMVGSDNADLPGITAKPICESQNRRLKPFSAKVVLVSRFGNSFPNFRDTSFLFSVACWSLKCLGISGAGH